MISTNLLVFRLSLDQGIFFQASSAIVGIFLLIAAVYIGYRLWAAYHSDSDFEIDEAEFGLGNQRIRLRPNTLDRQIAYEIWVELSTRKIGLKIDLDHDVIAEIYDSWYQFFGVTRDLIKQIPVTKFRRRDTERIVRLSVEVLNIGLRPHLTRWQARFRHWSAAQMERQDNVDVSPQDLQKLFPDYGTLSRDMMTVNARLIRYRDAMYNIVCGQ